MRKEENSQTQGTDSRFNYMNEKPAKPSRGACIAFGCLLAAIFSLFAIISYTLVGKLNDYYSQARESDSTLVDEVCDEPIGERIAAISVQLLEPADDPDEPEKEPEYSEQTIEFALYEIPVYDDDILVTPDSHGRYLLDAGKVYAIRWNASPLYRNKMGEVDADITATSKYLIEEGDSGTIAVSLCDYARDIIYSGKLDIMPTSGNLGIEFCAEECWIRSYGFSPDIEDSEFTLCFYTSGEFAKKESNSVSGSEGIYGYQYSVAGKKSDEFKVSQPDASDDTNDDTSDVHISEYQPNPLPPVDLPVPDARPTTEIHYDPPRP